MSRSIASTIAVTAALSSAALLAPTADAHQIVLQPEPTWTTNDKDTKYNPLAFLENQGFKTQEDFKAWREENGYKSLRDFMDNAKYTVTDGADFNCGFTDIKGAAQPIPAGNAMRSTGYTHDGPCEVWIDDTLAMGDDNCHSKFPGKDYTIDYSACKGTCTLRWYWLGVRFLKNSYSWQVYKACIPLTGTGGAPETSGSVATSAVPDVGNRFLRE
ncbi:thioredoxin reductase [Phytophthora boehmeriae]|uniref:Thioredoxin reductase n=1 Tax=Phytophthora boehmeriae TaxID=109152 RepID=A0A8T1WZ37_9STRA|nr:thioredoxin reductase [Phytophthora boehmeriae]